MNNKKINDNSSVYHISGFENSKRLGKFLSHEGTIQVLYALQKRPKLFKELDAELGLPSTTFERALRDLNKKANIIRKSPIVADNRETKQYVLNPIGKELIRLIASYEKFMSVPKQQQKIIEIENNK
jgi:DNA-binding HxlR family transcriptional regulator